MGQTPRLQFDTSDGHPRDAQRASKLHLGEAETLAGRPELLVGHASSLSKGFMAAARTSTARSSRASASATLRPRALGGIAS